mmetsp:Transcript_6813/g.8489  ORF Transcript_6813/g.8489 Transcript_6813/m.8489 type:complete len:309 (+) Transcript_6813:77-1003(+)
MKKANINSTKVAVLLVLCLQNSLFTVVRRYSQGVLKETYSKHEVLLFGEAVKMAFSAYMIYKGANENGEQSMYKHFHHLMVTSNKMFLLALIYGLMNILSYVALRNISASMFTICAQLKILTTATFSCTILRRQYSMVKWRALLSLSVGVLLFSEPIWNDSEAKHSAGGSGQFWGTVAVLTEVTLSGFASIYFEKVVKSDVDNLTIWERNFQLALGSFPIYLSFICFNGGDEAGYFGGWTFVTYLLALLGASGGLLVALSIKYGDAILKTLATTGAIILSSVLDHLWLGGPLTPIMSLAGCVVVLAIF